MTTGNHGTTEALLPTSSEAGLTVIAPSTPLRRLNYYDGKFLRAADMAAEQQYLRQLVALSNQAGGTGVVYGFDLLPAKGDQLQIGAGLAIDPDGNPVLLPQAVAIDVAELIERSKRTEPMPSRASDGKGEFADCIVESAGPGGGTVVQGAEIYLITMCRAEALCGEEEVYGKICEQACVTATDRPLRVEGIVVRAVPVTLSLMQPKAVAVSQIHLRSRVASAYYARERAALGSLISASRLAESVWCLGATHRGGCEVALGVLARAGATTLFVDAWTARRERMEDLPRRYWAWQMMMRPWNVYLAQILQFQCQLREVLLHLPEPGADDEPCRRQSDVLAAAATYFADIEQRLKADADSAPQLLQLLPEGASGLSRLQENLAKVLQKVPSRPSDRVLIDGGILELPPAGYLPVRVGTTVSVNDQVRALLGDGVDLQYCIVHPDDVAHALEEAQHMERISLVAGLDDRAQIPEVDILVPDGVFVDADAGRRARVFHASLAYKEKATGAFSVDGVARTQPSPEGKQAFYFAGSSRDNAVLDTINALEKNWAHLSLTGALAAPKPVIDTTRLFTLREGLAASAIKAKQLTFARDARSVLAPGSADLQALLPNIRAVLKDVPGSALWLEIASTKDLAAATDVGAPAEISGRILAAVGKPDARVAELTIRGSFYPTQVFPDGGSGRRLEGAMPNTVLILTTDSLGGNEESVQSRVLSLGLSLTYRGTADSGSLTIELLQQAGAAPFATIEQSWDGQTKTSTIEVSTGANALARMSLGEDTAALTEGPQQALAVTALDIIQMVRVGEPDFEDTAKGTLFAPLGDVASQSSIRAVNDWVLFHRRRTHQCEPLPVQKVPEPPRTYRVFEITTASTEEAGQLFKEASSPDNAAQKDVRDQLLGAIAGREPVLVVTFDGGSDALAGVLVSAIATDWPAFHPGSRSPTRSSRGPTRAPTGAWRSIASTASSPRSHRRPTPPRSCKRACSSASRRDGPMPPPMARSCSSQCRRRSSVSWCTACRPSKRGSVSAPRSRRRTRPWPRFARFSMRSRRSRSGASNSRARRIRPSMRRSSRRSPRPSARITGSRPLPCGCLATKPRAISRGNTISPWRSRSRSPRRDSMATSSARKWTRFS